jgi:3-hydroxyisobutyrate dehydrogenase
MKVAFIGLGVMGFPIAGHLARAGHEVTVYNRTAAKARRWTAEHPGREAATPADAAAGARMVFTCVTDDHALRQVVEGADGALWAMAEAAILVDHSSASPAIAREFAGLAAARGLRFLDAPVTGGEPGAVKGELGVMVGGDAAAFEAAAPVMGCYARRVRLMGPAGSGHLSKLVNVICAAGMGEAIAEGIGFARSAGLDLPSLVEVLSQGSSGSWVLTHKAPSMISGNYRLGGSFPVDLIVKDLRTALREAAFYGLDLPLLKLLEQRYLAIRERGGGGWDSASLIDLF